MAVRTLRLTELKAVLERDSAGKIIKSTAPATGTTTNIVSTTTTTNVAAIVPNLTLKGDSGTVTFDITQTNLSAIGGSNITTRIENGALVVGLNSQVNISQVNLTATGSANTFTSRDSNNKIQFGITSTGIPYMEPKSTLPPLISGLVYISGSNVVPEGYYLGYTGEPGTTEEGRVDLTP